MPPVTPPLVHIAAVALLRDYRVLLVRKQGTDRFMLPGAKFEPNEAAREVSGWEFHEEFGLKLVPLVSPCVLPTLQHLGSEVEA